MDMGAIFEKKGGILNWFDPRVDGAKSGQGADKGDIRPAAGKHSKKLEKQKKMTKLAMIITPLERWMEIQAYIKFQKE
jgi:hypothetical protein